MTTLTNAQVRKALRASKKKWKDIEAGKIADRGADNCALCQMFAKNDELCDCGGCPIAEHTFYDHCHGTPYDAFFNTSDFYGYAKTPQAKAAAREMVRFLEMLDHKYFVEGVTVE